MEGPGCRGSPGLGDQPHIFWESIPSRLKVFKKNLVLDDKLLTFQCHVKRGNSYATFHFYFTSPPCMFFPSVCACLWEFGHGWSFLDEIILPCLKKMINQHGELYWAGWDTKLSVGWKIGFYIRVLNKLTKKVSIPMPTWYYI